MTSSQIYILTDVEQRTFADDSGFHTCFAVKSAKVVEIRVPMAMPGPSAAASASGSGPGISGSASGRSSKKIDQDCIEQLLSKLDKDSFVMIKQFEGFTNNSGMEVMNLTNKSKVN